MQKAIFFSGSGTAYTGLDFGRENMELYPETVPALRFLGRRGFRLILATPEHQEFKWFVSSLRNKTLSLLHWDVDNNGLDRFVKIHRINLEESYFITDGLYLKNFQNKGGKIILVLSGRGFSTLESQEYKEFQGFEDVCKNIYAAAFSVALNK